MSTQPTYDTENKQQRPEANAAIRRKIQKRLDHTARIRSSMVIPVRPLDQNRGLALAGLILGIISLVAWIIPILGFIFAIVGIILSALGRRSYSRRRMATWGLVLSIIGLAITIGTVVYSAALYSH